MIYDRTTFLNTDLEIKKDLLKLFKKNDQLLILDIGGCEGEDSMRYAKLFEHSSIYVFEPLPKNQEIIIDNIKHYRLNNIKLFPIALSDTKGVCDFYVSSGKPEDVTENMDWDFGNKSSSLLSPDKVLETVKWLQFNTTIKVNTDTLSNVLDDQKVIVVDFIHLDVQGAELKVLYGAGDYLKKTKAIWLEIAETTLYKNQPLKKDIDAYMIANNFKLIKANIAHGVGDLMYINNNFFKETGIGLFKKFAKL